MAGVKATKEAMRLAKLFVAQNPNHPAAKQWLKLQQASKGLIVSGASENRLGLASLKKKKK